MAGGKYGPDRKNEIPGANRPYHNRRPSVISNRPNPTATVGADPRVRPSSPHRAAIPHYLPPEPPGYPNTTVNSVVWYSKREAGTQTNHSGSPISQIYFPQLLLPTSSRTIHLLSIRLPHLRRRIKIIRLSPVADIRVLGDLTRRQRRSLKLPNRRGSNGLDMLFGTRALSQPLLPTRWSPPQAAQFPSSVTTAFATSDGRDLTLLKSMPFSSTGRRNDPNTIKLIATGHNTPIIKKLAPAQCHMCISRHHACT